MTIDSNNTDVFPVRLVGNTGTNTYTFNGPKTIRSFTVEKRGDFFILKQIETFENPLMHGNAIEHVCKDEKEIVDYIQSTLVTERIEK